MTSYTLLTAGLSPLIKCHLATQFFQLLFKSDSFKRKLHDLWTSSLSGIFTCAFIVPHNSLEKRWINLLSCPIGAFLRFILIYRKRLESREECESKKGKRHEIKSSKCIDTNLSIFTTQLKIKTSDNNFDLKNR